ncbi:hypothetical protein F8388_025963 [Cannabis sativa]|uniref:Disease resistance R13L4/SHOC-2-like LRR domain-containing protein n=1 Tax=Cannabis sativa TaxID=3483 RepID=A0A7J6EE94_CANSA|nr:hypothetical protein F8388_025963 [Cannabis sativa]
MEKILERLNTFKEERYILDLRTNVEKIQSQRSPSMSSIDDAEFFATRLRTFLPINKNSFFSDALLQNELKELVKLKRLRFLSLEGYKNVKELPKSIGELRHLRHLDLSFTSIKELPKSLCVLYNLQTLKLVWCEHLTTFPKNLHHLINLRYVSMSFCNFSVFPPLGQLPALLTLSIEACDSVETVGLDFYGTSFSKPFPLLESLTFEKMMIWKEWSTPKEAFPKLKSLAIIGCHRLTGDLPHHLPSLTKLHIFCCPMLASLLPLMSNVSELNINQCKKISVFKSCGSVQNFDNLEDLHLTDCHNIEFLPQFISIQNLEVKQCSFFKLFPLDPFPNAKKIKIESCESLESFSLPNSQNNLSSLSISFCHNFTFLPDSNFYCPGLTQLRLFRCENLKFLPTKLPNLFPSLQQLTIYGCPETASEEKKELEHLEKTVYVCKMVLAMQYTQPMAIILPTKQL